jgi:hypothetical protein
VGESSERNAEDVLGNVWKNFLKLKSELLASQKALEID